MCCVGIVLNHLHKWFGLFQSVLHYHETFLYDEPEQCIVQIENQPNNNLYDFLVDVVD